LKTFSIDRILRDNNNKPIGRVILADRYKEGERIAVAIMEIPRYVTGDPKSIIVYIDGNKYKPQHNISSIKVGGNSVKHIINNFYLEPC